MKIKHLIEVSTETYEEQQFILDRFPGVWWQVRDVNNTRFYIPQSQGKRLQEAINEYEELNEK